MAKRADGELEAAVMRAVWDHGGWVTPGEVAETLAGGRPLAYTTVMTIMVRLCDKGRLERHRDGRSYVYCARQSREEATAARMTEVLADAGDRTAALSHFADALAPAERNQLRRLLRAIGA